MELEWRIAVGADSFLVPDASLLDFLAGPVFGYVKSALTCHTPEIRVSLAVFYFTVVLKFGKGWVALKAGPDLFSLAPKDFVLQTVV